MTNEPPSYRVPETVVSQRVGDAVILLDLSTGTYHSIDGSGATLWSGLEAGLSFPELLRTLTAEYEVDDASAAADAMAFVDDAVSRGLLGIE